jgi:hypothetical protein
LAELRPATDGQGGLDRRFNGRFGCGLPSQNALVFVSLLRRSTGWGLGPPVTLRRQAWRAYAPDVAFAPQVPGK